MNKNLFLLVSLVCYTLPVFADIAQTHNCCSKPNHGGNHLKYGGNGSTVLRKFLRTVTKSYKIYHPNSHFSYAGTTGSGQGITDLIDGRIRFAGSDIPPTDEQIIQALDKGINLLTIPVAVVGVSLAYNLTNYTRPLQLTAQNIADIFKGNILYWDDARLQANNRGLANAVGHLEIIPVIRTEGSGSTANFNLFLNAVLGSKEWPFSGEQTPVRGFGNPNTIKRKGSNRVARVINTTPGALGYVGFDILQTGTYANTQSAKIQNASGQFIAPSLESINEVLALDCICSDLRLNTINSPRPNAYPIANPTNIVVSANQPTQGIQCKLQNFLRFTVTEGNKYTTAHFLGSLTPAVIKQALFVISQIQ